MNFGRLSTNAFASHATSGGFDADGPSRALLPPAERQALYVEAVAEQLDGERRASAVARSPSTPSPTTSSR
jgi:hypothetical protein